MIRTFVLSDHELITNPIYAHLFNPELPVIDDEWAWMVVPGCPKFRQWRRWWYDVERMERVLEYEVPDNEKLGLAESNLRRYNS